MRKALVLLGIASMIALSACGNQNNTTNQPNNADATNTGMGNNMGNMDMEHSGSADVPQGLKKAQNPTYKVGDEVVIHAKHMPGMDGAKATVVGAYDTTAYAVTYTPTTGGEKVPNHKWVIQEDIKDAGSEPLKPGTTVTLEADHMEGMKGAQATIDSSEQTTVYIGLAERIKSPTATRV
ncbi:YdhK family protein [Cohnella massiliensis]|uniref:YdhK family protein n=1 Tax=Cohnella massiliensis TaxID=1816691 RepID=UPI0009B9CE2B|nr:YdhK family protein [Cohnella massiliensis]